MYALYLTAIYLLRTICTSAAAGSNIEIQANLGDSHAVSDLLYGLFFEEVHAFLPC